MKGITSDNILTMQWGFLCVCTCVCKLHMCCLVPLLNEVLRGSVGLADWIGQAHLLHRVRTSHWLEGGGRREGGQRRSAARQRETARYWRDASLFCFVFFFFLPLYFLTSLPGRFWKGRTERETQNNRDKGGKAERMKANVNVWVTLCVTCSVMLVRLPLPPQPASFGCQEKECFPEEWVPEPVHHVAVGQ